MLRRRFVRRGFGGAPTRTWTSVDAINTGWDVTLTATGIGGTLLSLQTPASNALTSDPPEDLTLLRIVGDFRVSVSTTAVWTLGLIVQDITWTPSTTFSADADKRWLWTQTYEAAAATTHTFSPPGWLLFDVGGTPQVAGVPRETTRIDKKLSVKLEPGKALLLVAYEASGAATFTSNSQNMRLLFQRTRRRT